MSALVPIKHKEQQIHSESVVWYLKLEESFKWSSVVVPTSISSCCWLKIVSCLNCRFFISSSRTRFFWLVSSFFIALKLFSSLYNDNQQSVKFSNLSFTEKVWRLYLSCTNRFMKWSAVKWRSWFWWGCLGLHVTGIFWLEEFWHNRKTYFMNQVTEES